MFFFFTLYFGTTSGHMVRIPRLGMYLLGFLFFFLLLFEGGFLMYINYSQAHLLYTAVCQTFPPLPSPLTVTYTNTRKVLYNAYKYYEVNTKSYAALVFIPDNQYSSIQIATFRNTRDNTVFFFFYKAAQSRGYSARKNVIKTETGRV